MASGASFSRNPPAGAPLRVIGSLAGLWILARLIAWILPTNLGMEPVNPTQEKTVSEDFTQTFNVGGTSPTEEELTPSDWPLLSASRKHVIKAVSTTDPGLIDSVPADPQDLSGRHSSFIVHPEMGGAEMQPVFTVKRAINLSPELQSNKPPAQKYKYPGKRPSGYFWVFSRQGSRGLASRMNRPGAIASNGQYGGSQMGAILSLPISTRLGPELAVYGRVTAALAPLAQEEVALGTKIKPVHNLPFSFHVEHRLDAESGGDRGSALFLAGGSGPHPIGEKLALETYAQAGYVAGKNETYFFDGSATVQRTLAESGKKKLSIGGGVWTGGQRGIFRVDAGPRADLQVPLGTTSAHIAVDWRVRVAGHAEPENGLAITVSTGF